MQLKHLQFSFVLCFFLHPSAGEGYQQLVDFVTQIKATHLAQCREIALVLAEKLPVASEAIQLESDTVPMYTTDGNGNDAVRGVSCGMVFTYLRNYGFNQSRHFFSNKAKLIFIVNTMPRKAFGISTVEMFMSMQPQMRLYNAVVVMFNANSVKGYYFDPFADMFKEVVNVSRSIYPEVHALKDLHNYQLHFAYIPSESDTAVINSIVHSLATSRNGSLADPIGLDPASMLNVSSTYQWHFTLLTLGPIEYATCFFVPKAGLVPIWFILIAPFDAVTWFGILLTGIAIVILLKLFGQASLFGSIIMLLQSVFTSPNRIARSYFERRILTACMLGCLVLVSSYQSIIYSLIANPIYNPELDTEQLINSSCAIFMLNNFEGIDTFRSTFVEKAMFRNGESCVCSSCQIKDLIHTHPEQFKLYRLSRHRTHPFPMLIALVDRDYPPLNELVQLGTPIISELHILANIPAIN
uniref:Ionotropic glutamate receptor C-terminal domain-containing protein n=1 Tax=Anopheles stephensi TaxID=30069 RepID=A0A182YRA5_ANOST